MFVFNRIRDIKVADSYSDRYLLVCPCPIGARLCFNILTLSGRERYQLEMSVQNWQNHLYIGHVPWGIGLSELFWAYGLLRMIPVLGGELPT